MPAQVSEVELLHLFSAQPGYRQMKLVRGPKQQVSCFVEFDDVVSASTVHQALQVGGWCWGSAGLVGWCWGHCLRVVGHTEAHALLATC